MQYKNPFSKIRAEQMGDSAWKYFVEPMKEYIGSQPLIFEGSRGTGKTMFFKCNSWREKLEESKSKGKSVKSFLEENKHIGLYYKVDGRFVKSLSKKNIDEAIWIGIFNLYFNIIITKEIVSFLNLLINDSLITPNSLKETIKSISNAIEEDEVENLSDLNIILDKSLLKIEKFSNNTEKEVPIGLNSGTIIEKLILCIKRIDILKSTTFHIFVDEFEVLNFNQQIELNTLLKQSNSDIVYDFGVITQGILTSKTGSGQELRPKDDYQYFTTDKLGYYESSDYNELLKQICEKRLKEELELFGKSNEDKFLDIEFYLKSYGKRYEETLFKEKLLELGKIQERILQEITRHSRLYNFSTDEVNEILTDLINCSPIQQRIHLALLMRKNKSAVPAKLLVKHFKENSKEYQDWIHNMESAAIILLCHELRVEKKYHGFKVFSALSSGVIRSFLELTEYAFDYAFNNSQNPFTFENPREFSIDEQTKAVYFISNFKIKEIDSYEPYGYRLRDFTRALGRIFHAIQTNPEATLGEVEQNHFETKVNELRRFNSEAEALLKNAVRNKILQEENPTKTKSNEIVEFTDYHLNHIYCPAFKISHLRKRKIPISAIDLAKLFCGSHKELEDVVNKLSGIKLEEKSPNLFSESDELSGEV